MARPERSASCCSLLASRPATAGETIMFEASDHFLFFDYFRIPYRVVGKDDAVSEHLPLRHPLRSCRWVRCEDGARGRRWIYSPPLEDSSAFGDRLPLAEYQLEGVRLFGRVLPDVVSRDWFSSTSTRWRRSATLRDGDGTSIASVWEDEQGNVFLPFDPDEAIQNYWSEKYRLIGSSAVSAHLKKLALRSYYLARPGLPRPLQISLRRVFARVQARARFPRWPVETGLLDLYAWLFRRSVELAGKAVPWLAPWPAGYSWALVLTHDVETSTGYRNLHLLRELEVESGYRSAWNFVPGRYEVDDGAVEELRQAGFEVGVHGLHHDGRDLESLETLKERLPAIRHHAQRWQASGFRSPSTRREWDWMPELGFDYDSSYPDTDPFEPQPGGCCSWLPYFNRDLVELPITLPQDHTLFVILRHSDETSWVQKATEIKDYGGMALLITHPDYVENGPLLAAYEKLLDRFREDATAWRPLPREVSAWWRRRAASVLEPASGGWRVKGPAAGEGKVMFARPKARLS